MGKTYYWCPGNARHDRAYSWEEARVAIGPGWTPLAERAWHIAERYGGGLVQVKEKFGVLRVYFRVPPEHDAEVQRQIVALETASRRICQACGWEGEMPCQRCPVRVSRLEEITAHEEMIPWDLPEWWAKWT